ncbi:Hcp family type VI secretion system effector [Xenorhabdus bharatensis]|uniref:Hcp family type VI secretion system effector n=1 Tax=Xenorhabdus bharatensis TaxID=3136256 RepID=UPI0030F45D32
MSTHSPASDAYLNLTGIQGETGDKEHKNWVAVHNFELILSTQVHKATQGPGLGAGIVSVGDLHLNLLFDKSTITLRQYVVTGKHIAEVKLHVRRQGEKQISWYELVLKNAMVAHTRIIYAGEGSFYCDATIAFQSHTETYYPQDSKGQKGAAVTYSWDSYTQEQK